MKALSFVLLLAATSAVAAPASLPVQGVLSDADGIPLTGDFEVVFSIYDGPGGEVALWSSAKTVSFEDGFFTAYLGDDSPLDLADFREGQAWLGISVDGDSEMSLVKLATAPYAGSADHAIEADTLEGAALADILDQIPSDSAVEALASGVCFDDVTELQAALDGVYLASGYVPDWSALTNIPAEFADGDDDTQYGAGSGLLFDPTTSTFSVDAGFVLSTASVPGALDGSISDYLSSTIGEGLVLDSATGVFSVDSDWVLNTANTPGALDDGIAEYLTTVVGEGLVFDESTGSFTVDSSFILDAASAPGALDDAIEQYLLSALPDVLDGDADTTYTAGAGLALDGTSFSLDYTPSWSELTDIPSDLADGDADTTYDAGAGLALDGTTFALDYTPTWSEIAGIPSDIADGDADTTYTAGSGLSLDGTTFNLDYTPAWADIAGIPSDVADGDADTTYTAGSGLSLDGTTFNLDYTPAWADIAGIPSDVADGDADTTYTAGSGLSLDGTTFNLDYTPSWSDLAGIPADLADGDADTTYSAGTGLSLDGTTFNLDYTPSWLDLTGIPADLADGDDDTTYSAGAGLNLSGDEFSVDEAFIGNIASDAIAAGTLSSLDVSGNMEVGGSLSVDGAIIGAARSRTGTPLKICAGSSPGPGWSAYGSGGLNRTISMSGCGFSSTPFIISSLHGNTSHWTTTGGQNVYSPTASSFRIFLISATGGSLSVSNANSWNWRIQWIAIGT